LFIPTALYASNVSGSSITINPHDLADFNSGDGLEIKFREITICEDGTEKKMIVLGSETYDGVSQ
jgi:hypothetical protein